MIVKQIYNLEVCPLVSFTISLLKIILVGIAETLSSAMCQQN